MPELLAVVIKTLLIKIIYFATCLVEPHSLFWSLVTGQQVCLKLVSDAMMWTYFDNLKMYNYNNHTLIFKLYGEVLANAVQGSFQCPICLTATTAVIRDASEAQTRTFGLENVW